MSGKWLIVWIFLVEFPNAFTSHTPFVMRLLTQDCSSGVVNKLMHDQLVLAL